MSLTNASSNNVIASFQRSLAPLGAIASIYSLLIEPMFLNLIIFIHGEMKFHSKLIISMIKLIAEAPMHGSSASHHYSIAMGKRKNK